MDGLPPAPGPGGIGRTIARPTPPPCTPGRFPQNRAVCRGALMGWFIVDGHEDIATALLTSKERDFGTPAPPGQALSLPDARRGGLGVILATIFAPEGYWARKRPLTAAREQLRLYEELLDRHQELIFRVESRGDLALCRPGGPIGVVHLVEGADPIASPDALPWWVDQGVRVIGLAWNTANRYCGGTNDDLGLTAEGRRLLEAMREQQLVCDVSHLNRRALEEVLLENDGIVVASHSNAHAIQPHRRNLLDEHVRAVAERGGLVGVMLYGPFLCDGTAELDDVVAHVDHLVEVAGSDHVGIGSDLDGGFTTDEVPTGIESVADLPKIGDALLRRGYTPTDVHKILGGNWMRILRESLPA